MPDATNFLGTLYTSTLPAWQRDYYEMVLLETLRVKSVLVPFTVLREDFDAKKTGTIIHSEVYDMDPNWNPLTEGTLWLKGGHLDSRTVKIELEIHGDILKFGDYNEIVQFINRGDIRGLVKEKIGQNMIDTLDILARNAFLEHPHKGYIGGNSRVSIGEGDLFNPDVGEIIRTQLEEDEIPGVSGPEDTAGPVIVCVTTPRVIKDIRGFVGSDWYDVQKYHQTGRKFTAEVGMWAGIRFIRTNRLRLQNHGEVYEQTTLDGDTEAGQGAHLTVDRVYTPGQPNSVRYITLADASGFNVGDYITIHSQNVTALGEPPLESDGTQETRRIESVGVGAPNRVSLNKPLLKEHNDGDYVTHGRDIHISIFMGGPGVVYGVGERPNPILPPKFDDLMYINRVGWRGFLKFQMFRPEYFRVIESAGSLDTMGSSSP